MLTPTVVAAILTWDNDLVYYEKGNICMGLGKVTFA
jgi:hypothetical protein